MFLLIIKYQTARLTETTPATPPTTPPTMAPVFEDVDLDAGDAVTVDTNTGVPFDVVDVELWEEMIFPLARVTPLPSVQHLALLSEVSQHKLPSAQVVRDTKMSARG